MNTEIFYGVFQYSFFDSYWSLIHFFSGMLIGLLLLEKFESLRTKKFYIGFFLLVLFELFEEFVLRNLKKASWFQTTLDSLNIGFLFGKESGINIFSDIFLGSIGLLIILFFFSKSKKNLS